MTGIPFTNSCKFEIAWVGNCGAPCIGKFCDKHDTVKCCVCGQQATHQCSYAGQFVCGAPLCNDCEGWEDRGKDAGGWGFLNHIHRLKSAHRPPPECGMTGDQT